MQIFHILKAYKLLVATEVYLPTAKPKHKKSSQRHTTMNINPEASVQTKKSSNKSRFSDDQIKSLESMFSSKSKPGSKTMQQIADQLGLHPRQVAVWFQNRRARTKSKQTEHDYSILKAQYDELASKFEALKNENHSLIMEVQRLRGWKGSPMDSTSETDPATFSSNEESNSMCSPEKHIAQPDNYIQDIILCETNTYGFNHFEQETDNQENMNMLESADRSLASSTNHSSLATNCLIDQNYIADWWDFWT